MKTYLYLLIPVLVLLAACEQTYNTETIVHEDGSLDRTITIISKEPDDVIQQNIFGTVPVAGWQYTIQKDSTDADQSDGINPHDTAGAKRPVAVAFTKHFPSVDEANKAMNGNDSLFHIESKIEKRFRWFYTYMRYQDTYKAINRYHTVPDSDYFTREDYAFIKRLPAEGKRISKADSLYLDNLNAKIYDVYGANTLFQLYFMSFRDLLAKPPYEPRWLDTLDHHKRDLYRYAVHEDKDMDFDFMVKFADSLHMPLTDNTRMECKLFSKHHEKIMGIMNLAGSGKYRHHIEMPWSIVATNADSLAGASVYWKPPVAKFLITDYTMYAEARKLNYWALIVSAVFIVFAGILIFRKRKE